MTKSIATLCLLGLSLFSVSTALADSVPVGDIEFNNLTAGVNDFTVNNFTGLNNLGFFPVENNVTFEAVVITAVESDGTALSFDLGSLSPGTDTSSQVPSSVAFTSVTLTTVLDTNKFQLTNGLSGNFTADPSIIFTLLPSEGDTLTAGVDLGTINASELTTVPEPSTFLLLGFSLAGILSSSIRIRTSKI
jgi:hypothetical protein